MSIASKVVGLLKGVFGLAKTSAGLQSDYRVLAPDGLVSAPAYSFSAGTDIGWYRNLANVHLAYSGVRRLSFDLANNATAVSADGTIAWSNTSGDASTTRDVGLARAAAGVVRITNGSTGAAGLSSAANSPAQITADQNNYAAGVGLFQRWSSDAARTVTGMVAGQDGEARFVWNVGAQSIVLAHENVGSTAANRFTTSTAASLTVTAGKCALCQYDVVSARWRATLLP